MSLMTELRRRNVFRVGVAYAIVGWLLLEVASVIFPGLHLPDWTLTFLIVLVVAGFPLALILAWAFEMTPEGLKREAEVDRTESTTHVTGRKLDFAIIGLLAIALIFVVVDNYVLEAEPEQAGAVPEQVPAAETVEREKSIAVLPFDNISPNPEDAYFADGIHDEILAQISKIRDIKVISRTSVMRYRGEDKPSSPEIGVALGVANLLEGSVRLAGNRVRITIQFIEAERDAHLWTETYDRELTAANIFTIQSEIAKIVADALRATLTPEEKTRLATVPTENLDAYQAYLLGMQRMVKMNSYAFSEAVNYLERSIELDPNFALAYVALASSYMAQIDYGGLPPDEMIEKAQGLVERALELDDRSGEAYSALGFIHAKSRDFEGASAAYQRALELSPNHAESYNDYGQLLRDVFLRPEEALALHKKAVELNPLSTHSLNQVGWDFDCLGRFDEELTWFEKSLAVNPGDALTSWSIGWNYHLSASADYSEAVRWLRKSGSADPGDNYSPAGLGWLFMDLGDPDRAERWIRRSIEVGPESWIANYSMQLLQLYLGDELAALEYGRKADQITRAQSDVFPFQLIADHELRAGRYSEARALYEENRPALLNDAAPTIDATNYRAAIDLASVLFKTGEQDQADRLLDASYRHLDTHPRMGNQCGYGIADVKIYALQGEKQKALSTLRKAIDEGWRLRWWYYLRLDPGLESLHDEPKYQAMVAEIEADMAAQLARVREMERNGELEPIPEVSGRLDSHPPSGDGTCQRL